MTDLEIAELAARRVRQRHIAICEGLNDPTLCFAHAAIAVAFQLFADELHKLTMERGQ